MFKAIKWMCVVGAVVTAFTFDQSKGASPVELLKADWSKGIHKVSENLYVGQIKDRDLRVVMERVDEVNIRQWQQYISVQSNPRVVSLASCSLPRGGTTGDGSLHFQRVLADVNYLKNEIWVAYVTRAAQPTAIPDEMKYYSIFDIDSSLSGGGNTFARDIQMSVTVTSSPDALITSHMGIARSFEGSLSSEKGISMDLHSFAAKVMLLRNPDRKYMINAPVFAMEEIVLKALPQDVFVGTREMQKILEERLNSGTIDDFMASHPSVIEKIKDEEKEGAKEELENVKRWLSEVAKMEGNKDDIERTEARILKKIQESNPFLEINSAGEVIVSKSKREQFLKEAIKREFKSFKTPYWCEKRGRELSSEEFFALLKEHPPLLSVVAGYRGKFIQDEFTVFDKDNPAKPWLEIHKGNPNYQWMFTEPFSPAGATHYVVVDLAALARCRELEPVVKH